MKHYKTDGTSQQQFVIKFLIEGHEIRHNYINREITVSSKIVCLQERTAGMPYVEVRTQSQTFASQLVFSKTKMLCTETQDTFVF